MNFMRASSQKNTLFTCPACGRRFSIRDITRHIDGVVNVVAMQYYNCANCSAPLRVDVSIRFRASAVRMNSIEEDISEVEYGEDYHKIF